VFGYRRWLWQDVVDWKKARDGEVTRRVKRYLIEKIRCSRIF